MFARPDLSLSGKVETYIRSFPPFNIIPPISDQVLVLLVNVLSVDQEIWDIRSHQKWLSLQYSPAFLSPIIYLWIVLVHFWGTSVIVFLIDVQGRTISISYKLLFDCMKCRIIVDDYKSHPTGWATEKNIYRFIKVWEVSNRPECQTLTSVLNHLSTKI